MHMVSMQFNLTGKKSPVTYDVRQFESIEDMRSYMNDEQILNIINRHIKFADICRLKANLPLRDFSDLGRSY